MGSTPTCRSKFEGYCVRAYLLVEVTTKPTLYVVDALPNKSAYKGSYVSSRLTNKKHLASSGTLLPTDSCAMCTRRSSRNLGALVKEIPRTNFAGLAQIVELWFEEPSMSGSVTCIRHQKLCVMRKVGNPQRCKRYVLDLRSSILRWRAKN